MKEIIIQFVCEYWREILSIVCCLISVVFYVIKRRPSVNLMDSIKEDVLELLPVLINKVESPGNGQLKKKTVIDAVITYVKKKYQVSLSSVDYQWLSDVIESILSTPTKKGN